MTSAVTPASDTSALLKGLSAALIRLHKALVDAETQEYGPVNGGPYQLLSLLTHHPHFAWLHDFSRLISEIDHARSPRGTIISGQVAGYRRTVERLVSGAATAEGPSRYAVLLERFPAVAAAHGDVRRVLEGLPGAH